jgi:hypothetical protein
MAAAMTIFPCPKPPDNAIAQPAILQLLIQATGQSS